MAEYTDNVLAAWEFPKRLGIRIRPLLNRHGGEVFAESYRVEVPARVTGRGPVTEAV